MGNYLAGWSTGTPIARRAGNDNLVIAATVSGAAGIQYRRVRSGIEKSSARDTVLENHELGLWMTQLEQRAHKNVVAAALANKIARIAWAVLPRQEVYRSTAAVAQ